MSRRLRTTFPDHRLSAAQKERIVQIGGEKIDCRFSSAPEFSVSSVLLGNGSSANTSWIDSSHNVSAQSTPAFQEILDQLRADPNIPLLFDRQEGLFRSRIGAKSWSVIDRFMYVTAVAWSTYVSQQKAPEDFKLLASTPHGLANYISVQAKALMGVQIYIIGRTVLDNYAKVYRGVGRTREPLKICALTAEEKQRYFTAVSHWEQKATASYEDAIPWYEKERAIRLNGKVFDPLYTLKQDWNKPWRAWNAYSCWRMLQQYTPQPSQDHGQRYVVFFLQFQPERTSLPEAWGFTQQYDAVHLIRRCLPPEINLIVREHPSTFRNRCHPAVRTPKFYEAIAAIPGVQFGSLKSDPFKVIDSALAVVTLTGTVGAEAAARGTPSIFLGTSMVGDVEGIHHYKNELLLRTFLEDLLGQKIVTEQVKKSFGHALQSDADFVFKRDSENFSGNTADVVPALEALVRSGLIWNDY